MQFGRELQAAAWDQKPLKPKLSRDRDHRSIVRLIGRSG